ncbi:MAG: hypothetical protein AAGC74_00925 [Verrucomicrobiota bacterium]
MVFHQETLKLRSFAIQAVKFSLPNQTWSNLRDSPEAEVSPETNKMEKNSRPITKSPKPAEKKLTIRINDEALLSAFSQAVAQIGESDSVVARIALREYLRNNGYLSSPDK